jgi:hypothetical protein
VTELTTYVLVGFRVGEEAGGGAEAEDTGLHARHVAEVAGGGVVDEAELVGEARRDAGVVHVPPHPEPPVALVAARAALRRFRRRPVRVREACRELATGAARQQHDRVHARAVVPCPCDAGVGGLRRGAVQEEDGREEEQQQQPVEVCSHGDGQRAARLPCLLLPA